MSISVIGLSTTDFVPGSYLAVNFGQGASGGQAAPIDILLMGNALASAPIDRDGYVYGPDVEGFVIASESDVINQCGRGSELHRGYRRIIKTNPGVPIYLLAVTESAGAAASLAVTFATTALANGYVRVYVCDGFVDTPISVGDTPSVVATNVVASILSQLDWPVSASANSGVVTIAAKQHGPRGNFIRVAAKIQGSGVGTTSSAQNFAYLAGGATEDSWSAALATIDSMRFDYIVPAAEDTTSSANLGLLVEQVNVSAQPIPGIRQRVVAGTLGPSVATANSAAKALNCPLADLVWQQNSNLTPFELAASAAAAYTLGEDQSVPMLNFDSCGATPATQAMFQVSNPFDGSLTSRNDIKSALTAGVTPIVASATSSMSYIVSAITTFSQDPVSGNLDTRVRDHAIPTVMFLAADLLQDMWASQFAGKLAADDPAKGERPPGNQVVTPTILKASINKIISQMGENGLLQEVAVSMAATIVNREVSPDSRFTANINIQPVSLAHQFAANVNQVNYLS